MSILDQLRDLERQVVGRLRELEPLMREYEQLRKAAQRFGIKYTPNSSRAAATSQRSSTRRRSRAAAQAGATTARRTQKRPTTRPARKPVARGPSAARSRARRGAAATGQRTEEVLRLVGENPGITTSEIGKRLNVNSTGLYRVVRRLTEEGRLRKEGAQLHPVATAPSTPDAEPKPGPSAAPAQAARADSPATAEDS